MKIDDTIFFHDVTVCLCSSLDIQNSLSECFSYMKSAIPMESISVFWYDSRGGAFQGIAQADSSGCRRIDIYVPLPKILRKYNDSIELQPYTRIYQKSEKDPYISLLAKTMKVEGKSILGLPIAIDGVHIGMVGISSSRTNTFTREHANILSSVHDPFAIAISNCKKHEEIITLKNVLSEDNQFLIDELNRPGSEEIVGEEFGLKSVMDMVRQVAPRDNPVLLLGETGVGKELIANRLHYNSERKKGPFIKVNCGAIPETLIDSELFGHERGSFTGAEQLKKGRFERAHKGTIFLDEIGELPLSAQVRLLRVIQQREIERVGGTETISLDIRIIAATHRDLDVMVEEGGFREDLLFRLNVFPINIPPLRERKFDVPALIGHFLKLKCRKLNIHIIPPLSPDSIEELIEYEWKGNVRELENEVERALISYDADGWLVFDCLIPEQDLQIETEPNEMELNKIIAIHIKSILDLAKGKINGPDGAAQLLKINPNTLRNKMNKLGITYGRKKGAKT
ncbi:MAG: AAA domain-containing protein [Desulfobacterales bacterium]|nr:AAA domain-containing protein [Desulfobacterales bacterium]